MNMLPLAAFDGKMFVVNDEDDDEQTMEDLVWLALGTFDSKHLCELPKVSARVFYPSKSWY